ncbi:hypothetical protein HMPREF9413_5311 [Paenibacillus sp. HGF7]|nr:hypothetical protein HMPREF9413_5311 [Paenibacillus sp. HGF7]
MDSAKFFAIVTVLLCGQPDRSELDAGHDELGTLILQDS